ncbi:NDP-hexose 2,3-dehydratase family protein [Nonomuraea typhae]|uniref:NDP-hexose 2,3-dehydratase family protein n=1 Tax=Nonomuraea typhae TaxID=2603600 RepID=UPI002484041D|nr:NDP-hexose 2,3-dehydratase family protein [Nonomuraea typhae]
MLDVRNWFEEVAERTAMTVERLPLDELGGWSRCASTGNIRHDSGKFFTVQGLDVRLPGRAVDAWTQPIINQPEVGILGILIRRLDGGPQLLMQAKNEPGNHDGPQVSPTVQATRSNYTRVHKGRPVPYLEHFRNPSGRVLADVRQSEQGAWFYRKRNRNMVVEVGEDVEVLDGFRWLTLEQVHGLLAVPDLVNMDARTVLACLPVLGRPAPGADGFRAALIRSRDPRQGAEHGIDEVLSWLSGIRSTVDISTEPIPLNRIRQWHRSDGRISHESGRFFDIIGVRVVSAGREVSSWTQPMIEPIGTGVVAFLVRRIGGVLHALVHARVEPGYTDVVELAPTVQCVPANYDHLPPAARPLFLDAVLGAPPERIRYDTVLSEEGGRFYHARNRYLIVETDEDPAPGHPDFRWLAMHQVVELLRHSYYLNVQARTLSACLDSLTSAAG